MLFHGFNLFILIKCILGILKKLNDGWAVYPYAIS